MVFSAVLILTPIVNGIVQRYSGNDSLKKISFMTDQLTYATTKVINTAALTTAIFLNFNMPAAVIVGVGFSALSILSYRKE